MTRSRGGFTMVELMVVMIIIGILASIAMPRVQATKEKAWLATARSDARNAETAEEEYFSDNGTYGTTDQLRTSTSFKVTPGDTVTILLNSGGYQVTAVSSAISSGINGCEVSTGYSANPLTAGQVNCDLSSH